MYYLCIKKKLKQNCLKLYSFIETLVSLSVCISNIKIHGCHSILNAFVGLKLGDLSLDDNFFGTPDNYLIQPCIRYLTSDEMFYADKGVQEKQHSSNFRQLTILFSISVDPIASFSLTPFILFSFNCLTVRVEKECGKFTNNKKHNKVKLMLSIQVSLNLVYALNVSYINLA
jgi:hypothetical protein